MAMYNIIFILLNTERLKIKLLFIHILLINIGIVQEI
jgi:hypothetical protein